MMVYKFIKYIVLLVFVFSFGLFIGYVNRTEQYNYMPNYDINTFYIISSGGKNAYVDVIITALHEGMLTFRLYNNTSHYLGNNTDTKFFKKTSNDFKQLSRIEHEGLFHRSDVFLAIPPFCSMSHKFNFGFWYFEEGNISPGIYKIVRILDIVSNIRYGDLSSLGNLAAYVVFEIK